MNAITAKAYVSTSWRRGSFAGKPSHHTYLTTPGKVVSSPTEMTLNTITAELWRGNSTDLRHTTFSIITQYANSAYLTVPPARCMVVY